MKPAVLFACLITVSFGGCSWAPRAGPSASELVEQGQADGQILFDVVEVDDRVVSTLLAQPKESFQARFRKNAEPTDLKIAVGDTISVLIWESAAGGLFSEAPATSTAPSLTEPLAPESQPLTGQRGISPPPERTRPQERQPPGIASPPGEALSLEAMAATSGRGPATIPDQQVGADGAISIPYAGRIPAAGRSPAEVQQTIEEHLAQKALQPQALVIVRKSAANAVTVAGEPAVTGETAGGATVPLSPSGGAEAQRTGASGFGAIVPLSQGGDRLLQVIAAAGGPQAPVYDTVVRLSRDGVTATILLERLVSNPGENIYAQPGDVLTLVQIPQTFSVFGAAGRNADIRFEAEKITLSEALAKSQGLRDDLANPKGVFLFRYEPDSVVRALDQPIATRAQDGRSPVAYRFDFKDGKSYFLADRFPVRDKDIIFVADAAAVQVQKLFTLLSTVTGPVITGLLTCRSTRNC